MKHKEKPTYYVAVKDKGFADWQHHEVPEAVYRYIRQLEIYINNPNTSLVLSVYPERFAHAPKFTKS